MEPKCIENALSEFGCGAISWGLYVGYFLIITAIAALVLLPLRNALKAPGELMKSGMAILVLVVLFGISYALSGDEVSLKAASLGEDAGSSKLIGAGLIMFYFVFFASIIGLIYSEIKKSMM